MDIFFISFRESNSETNWIRLKELHPTAVRLHGIKGIDKVHLLCEQLSESEYFWTVDGDNWITRPLINHNSITSDLVMFSAIDPLDNSPTLLGGVKLWRKGSIINKEINGDFSLNATNKKVTSTEIYSITKYNDSPYDAWKTSFRHCVKLMSVLFKDRPNAKNIDSYLNRWKACQYKSDLNSNWAYQGYLDAHRYVELFDHKLLELNKINNYDWLETYFRYLHESS